MGRLRRARAPQPAYGPLRSQPIPDDLQHPPCASQPGSPERLSPSSDNGTRSSQHPYPVKLPPSSKRFPECFVHEIPSPSRSQRQPDYECSDCGGCCGGPMVGDLAGGSGGDGCGGDSLVFAVDDLVVGSSPALLNTHMARAPASRAVTPPLVTHKPRPPRAANKQTNNSANRRKTYVKESNQLQPPGINMKTKGNTPIVSAATALEYLS